MLYQTCVLTPTKQHLAQLAEHLREGAVVGIPTETVYGLAANALSEQAVAQIFCVKGRPADNPLIVHLASLDRMEELVAPLSAEMQLLIERLAARFWPGPLTFVLPKAARVPAGVTAGLETVGIRIPNHPVTLALLREVNLPLAAPSANLSGRPSPTTAAHVLTDLGGKIPSILDGGDCAVGVESTVVRLLAGGELQLLRPGGVSVEELQEVVPNVLVHEGTLTPPRKGEAVLSPGMKYRHYAPKAPMTLVTGGVMDFYQRVCDAPAGTVVLTFEEEQALFAIDPPPLPCVSYGSRRDAAQQARRLFGALRELDEDSCCKQIFAHAPSQIGMGLAVYNRLLRAACFAAEDITGMQVVGLTGQTGAGKSLIGSKLAKRVGVGVIDCDAISHELLDSDAVRSEVLAAFPADADRLLQPDDPTRIDRKVLGGIVFSDASLLKRLTNILYPRIKQQLLRRLLRERASGQRLLILDAPTLFESGADVFCDRIVGVVAPKEQRKRRIMQRDRLTEPEADRRLAAGQADDFYRGRVDYLLHNHGSEEQLEQSLSGCLGDLLPPCSVTS